jgi:prepilin-type N-terminal cleavage/methylation domain-containing protein
MNTTTRTARLRAFTLVELLTVVAIIALLIGILVPTVSKARDSAKRASVQNLQAALGKGCEMFHADLGRYPRSSGLNPFEEQTDGIELSGAQWLLLELAGADLKGYVMQDKTRYYDSDGNGVIDPNDWLYWYSSNQNAASLRRFGPYVPLEGKVAQSPAYYRESTAVLPGLPDSLDPDQSTAGTSIFNNGRLPFAVDAFGMPVLYYVANEQAKEPFSNPTGYERVIGRYSQEDNWQFTGAEARGSNGYDLGGGVVKAETGQFHWLWDPGWGKWAQQVVRPNSFAAFVYDAALYEQSGTAKRVWPHRPETFIFISPGKDAIFGNADDVTNF